MIKKIASIVCLLLIIFFASVPPAVWCENRIAICFGEKASDYESKNIFDTYKVAFTNQKILIICGVVALILVLFVLDIYFTIKKAKIENKGIKFKVEDGTFGTANWMNETELEESFEVGTEDGIVVGKINNKIITLPNNTRHNKNIAVFGASGSKKSRGFVIPNILNLAEQGKSMILTDPKGELYKKTYKFLKSKGYNVKILNLVDMDKSDRWNPFSVIENEIDAQIFSEIVIENTQLDKSKGQDEFWSRTGQNLLKALALGQTELLKNPEERSMSKIYNTLSTGDIKAISGKLDVETYFILDEFPNIGKIPDFEKKLSTMRSRGVNTCIIFQSIAQLKNRYPNDVDQVILGNCDTKICLGCSEMMSAEYVSKLLRCINCRN